MARGPDTVTILLNQGQSAQDRINQLLPLVYNQLRGAAQQAMSGERPDHTLSATAIVHEAYLKLVGPRDIPWANRAHFYAAAAQSMRQVLLDHARAKGSHKRGGQARHLDLDAGATLAAEDAADFVALDAAISRLEAEDPRAAQIVRLRYFTGLSIEQTALALDISERTVKNDWAFARAWLGRELGPHA